MADDDHGHRAVYDRSAADWDAARSASYPERRWIDALADSIPPAAPVLDLGCGSGVPIASDLIARGFPVTGVDFAPAMLALARARHPGATWIEADMRCLDLGRAFAAVIAWDSFFHLRPTEQSDLIPRIAAHLRPGGVFLFTSGFSRAESWGRVAGGPVWHSSLSPAVYAGCLEAVGLHLRRFVAEDPETAGRTVWLTRKCAPSPDAIGPASV